MTEDEIKYSRYIDYHKTFSSEAGKRVLDDMKKAFCNRTSHVAGDSHETAFHEGERSVVLRIDHIMNEARKMLRQSPRPEGAETE